MTRTQPTPCVAERFLGGNIVKYRIVFTYLVMLSRSMV
jgi:hypothetical protein